MLISDLSKDVASLNRTSGQIIAITKINTPLGLMNAAAIEEGICLLDFADQKNSASQIKKLQTIFKSDLEHHQNAHLENLAIQLGEYFSKQRTTFSLPLILTGTEFQNKVWRELLSIPYGKTLSYKEQAYNLGNTKAVRAVATANANNRISIIIPCHRVIASNGSLAGYAGGLERKQSLLRIEAGK